MYTAKIINKTQNELGVVNFIVQFTRQDGLKINHIFSGVTSREELKKHIKSQIDFYVKSDSAKDDVQVDEVIDLTEDIKVPVEKTPEEKTEETKLQEYQELCAKQDRLEKDIRRGVITKDNENYVDVCTKLKNKYRPKYSGM